MTTAKKSKAMPKWQVAPVELIQVFEKALKSVPEAQTRKVFGYPAAFMNGQMFAGLHQDNMILRLSDNDRRGLIGQKGAKIFEPMPGRPMREYVVVPVSILKSTKQLDGWLGKALAYAQSLPPKAARSRGKREKG